MLPIKLHLNRPSLPWQRTLKHNGFIPRLAQQILPRSLHLTEESRLKFWQLYDVSQSLPQPTLVFRYNE